LIDIARLPDLQEIRVQADAVWVGAAVKHQQVATHAELAQALPALAELAGLIGDPQVRARGTLGGSIANNDPAADYPAAVLALGATVVTTQREIAADDFFLGMALRGAAWLSPVPPMLSAVGRKLKPPGKPVKRRRPLPMRVC
jgi:carbon-monoxide dehydrogenase medium subunit